MSWPAMISGYAKNHQTKAVSQLSNLGYRTQADASRQYALIKSAPILQRFAFLTSESWRMAHCGTKMCHFITGHLLTKQHLKDSFFTTVPFDLPASAVISSTGFSAHFTPKKKAKLAIRYQWESAR